jgi:hypothetical protein
VQGQICDILTQASYESLPAPWPHRFPHFGYIHLGGGGGGSDIRSMSSIRPLQVSMPTSALQLSFNIKATEQNCANIFVTFIWIHWYEQGMSYCTLTHKVYLHMLLLRIEGCQTVYHVQCTLNRGPCMDPLTFHFVSLPKLLYFHETTIISHSYFFYINIFILLAMIYVNVGFCYRNLFIYKN